jgi:hypothetical protein
MIDVAGLKNVALLPDAYRITRGDLEAALTAERVARWLSRFNRNAGREAHLRTVAADSLLEHSLLFTLDTRSTHRHIPALTKKAHYCPRAAGAPVVGAGSGEITA